MGKILLVVNLLSFSLLLAFLQVSAPARVGTMSNPGEMICAKIESASPQTVDPAWAYDTASGELVFNVYETLLTFDGECVGHFIPLLATEWTVENITGTISPEGLPWHFTYMFKIRTGVRFHDGSTLTAEDVEYSFERAMVRGYDGGPQWMFYESLLNGSKATFINGVDYDLSITEEAIRVGKMIDHSIESNASHVWFNIVFPGAYAPFLQILSQPWSSILSRRWINDYVIGVLGRADWNGNWEDYSGWVAHQNLAESPLDSPTPLMDGTGPFMLESLDYTGRYWSATRNSEYWRGWPADWPSPPYPPSAERRLKPSGYVERVRVTWAHAWDKRKTMFLDGDVDFVDVPRSHIEEMLGQNETRCIYPLPSLSLNSMFFVFSINVTTSYGRILPAGTFNESGIPCDFFGNATWGLHVRKAFAYVFDYDTYITQVYRGEAQQPATAVLSSSLYYDSTIKGYSYNLTRAAQEFQQVPGLWDAGFTMTIVYGVSSSASVWPELVKAAVENLNSKFHVALTAVPWQYYIRALHDQQLSIFMLGFLADYPDAYNFACEFYHSSRFYAKSQGYSNSAMDELIMAGADELDPAKRANIYRNIQVLAIEDCASVPVVQPTGRHFERNWVRGWYYNPGYPGLYFYPLWKQDTLLGDVNCDGTVNILDIASIARAFDSAFGPPLHPRWNFRCDVDNNRMIDIVDISKAAINFS